MNRKTRRRRKGDPPREGIYGAARYWIYVWDGIDSGVCVGWTNNRARAIAWTRESGGGWTFDRRSRLKYTARGRVA